jgi:glycosyltransferase involved in cell wall biosynthesis
MTIVYFYRALAIKGGLEKILIDKMNYLSDYYDYNVYIITSDQGLHPLAYKLHPNVKHIDLNINFHNRFKYKLLKRFYFYECMKHAYKIRIFNILSKINADILIFNTHSLLEMHLVKSIHVGPVIVESHQARSIDVGKRTFLSDLYHCYLKFKREQSIKKTTTLVCLTYADAAQWKNIKKAVVIPNMINHPLISESRKHETYKRIICVGRISRVKGYDLLIEAWHEIYKKYPEWRIDIFGNGDMEDEIRDKIRELHLSNFFLKGLTDNVYVEYIESDFLVLSSRFEGFGLVLAEAMSCGIPCVAFDCPCGPADIIHNKEDGLLVENGNIDKMAESISWMIEHEEERLRMGQLAKQNIGRFYPEKIMPIWDNFFHSIIGDKCH